MDIFKHKTPLQLLTILQDFNNQHVFTSKVKNSVNPEQLASADLDLHRKYLDMHAKSQKAVCLFNLILYVPVNIFSVMLDRSSWVEPVLSKD